MQAIQVKYLGATDTKGTRVKAWSYSGEQVTLNYNHEHEMNINAREACMKLLVKLEWGGAWIGGCLPNQDYAFVCVDRKAKLCVGV